MGCLLYTSYVEAGDTDGIEDLLIGPARGENREAADENRLAGGGQAAGQAGHIGFRDAGVKKALRGGFPEIGGHGGFGQVSVCLLYTSTPSAEVHPQPARQRSSG